MASVRNWDVTLGGVFGIAVGLLDLLSVWGQPQEQTPHGMLVTSLGAGPGVAAGYGTIVGILHLVAGYGLIKVRTYSWWVVVVLVAGAGVPISLASLQARPFEASVSLCGVPVGVAWLWFRLPLFRPFGGRLRYEKPSPAQGDLLALMGKSAAVAGLIGTLLAVARQCTADAWPVAATVSAGVLEAALIWLGAICVGAVYGMLSYWRFRKQHGQGKSRA